MYWLGLGVHKRFKLPVVRAGWDGSGLMAVSSAGPLRVVDSYTGQPDPQ